MVHGVDWRRDPGFGCAREYRLLLRLLVMVLIKLNKKLIVKLHVITYVQHYLFILQIIHY
jgi:hypothetical protein